MFFKYLKEKKYLIFFIVIIFILFFAFSFGYFQNPSGTQKYIFHAGLESLFADFFSVLNYISERDPYFKPSALGENIYFPLSYLILYPISQLDNFNTTLEEALKLKIGIMSVFIFTLFSVFLLIISLNEIRKKYNVSSFIFISLIFNYVFFFSIERGNTIILCAAFTGFFIAFYDSDKNHERLLAIFSIAIAATLKVYPALFGILYLEKRQYKEILYSSIFTLFLIFIPFLFFKNGFTNIPQLINNIKINNERYNYTRIYTRFSLAHIIFYGARFLNFSEKMIFNLSGIANIFNIFISIISIISSFLIKNKWIKISLLTMTLVFFPVNSGYYCGLYIFPMIIIYFATLKERAKIFNIFIFIVFIIFLNPIQFTLRHSDKIFLLNYIFSNIFLLLLWIILIIISGKKILNRQ